MEIWFQYNIKGHTREVKFEDTTWIQMALGNVQMYVFLNVKVKSWLPELNLSYN